MYITLWVFTVHCPLIYIINCFFQPSTSFTIIVMIFKNINGTRATVRIDLIRFKICDLAVAVSPKPWTFCHDAQPTFARNLSSFKIQTAFKHNTVTSKSAHNVNAMLYRYDKYFQCSATRWQTSTTSYIDSKLICHL